MRVGLKVNADILNDIDNLASRLRLLQEVGIDVLQARLDLICNVSHLTAFCDALQSAGMELVVHLTDPDDFIDGGHRIPSKISDVEELCDARSMVGN